MFNFRFCLLIYVRYFSTISNSEHVSDILAEVEVEVIQLTLLVSDVMVQPVAVEWIGSCGNPESGTMSVCVHSNC